MPTPIEPELHHEESEAEPPVKEQEETKKEQTETNLESHPADEIDHEEINKIAEMVKQHSEK